VLLELRDDLREQIDGIRIVVVLGELARFAQALEVELDPIGDEPDVLGVARRRLWILGQPPYVPG
jgi:hypothetical protein